jgi:methylenetetrahydrofolate reductase (NADPH)
MKIKEILQQRRTVSCEFFPPRTAEAIPTVLRAIERVSAYQPDFVSVTYGAGGSTRAFTREITQWVKKETPLEVMAHLTCVAQTREEVHDVLQSLERDGIENIIALRGDPPQGQSTFVATQGGFAHASELIDHVKAHFRFGIAAACYPEGHTESPDLESDIRYARLKVEKGADFLISQLFLDNRDYFFYVEQARQAGINVPIIPGILPILNTAQIRRFTALCGAKIPPDLDRELERLAEDEDAVRELGVNHATEQVRELWDSGVPGVHFYVLNRSYSVARILDNLNLPGHHAAAG